MHFLIEGECEQERRVLESKNPHNQRKFTRQHTGAGGQKARKRKRARRANAVLKGTTRATAGEWANERATS